MRLSDQNWVDAQQNGAYLSCPRQKVHGPNIQDLKIFLPL